MLTPMRDAGLIEREINNVNRAVPGLGVTLEPSWPGGLQVLRDYDLGQH